MPQYAYIKSGFVTADKAVIAIGERGFRFGDGVFETIRVANGHPYQWELHMARLQNGLKLLKIHSETANLKNICMELLEKNKLDEGFLRISISRGIGSKGYLPDVKGGATVIAETIDKTPDITGAVDLWLGGYKKMPSAAIPAKAKTMQGLNSILARMEAQENNCFEALLTDAEGYICEGSSSNIFWLKGETLFTPSLELDMLPGTMRDAVIRLFPYKVDEGRFTLDDLREADEVFLTNSNWLALPVQSLRPVDLEWKSISAAGKVRELILKDIKEQCT